MVYLIRLTVTKLWRFKDHWVKVILNFLMRTTLTLKIDNFKLKFVELVKFMMLSIFSICRGLMDHGRQPRSTIQIPRMQEIGRKKF
jgi:hypothetical protein